MYQNIWYSKEDNSISQYGTIHLWDDEYGYIKFPYRPYAYKKDVTGDIYSLTGVRLKKVTNWSIDDVEQGLMYESDVDAVMRTLIDRYYESDEVSINHKKWVLDIEVSMVGGTSEPDEAANEITTIGLREIGSEKRIILVLDKHKLFRSRQIGDINILSFDSELKLLNNFLMIFAEIAPTIVTGWNVAEYDFPYLYNRIKNVLGKKFADKISPIGLVSKHKNDNNKTVFSFAGFSILDYMILYKQFNYNEEPSYRLDAISKKELGRGKIEYDGTLDDLFRDDIEKFIQYNIADCDLVNDLDEKLDFINLAMTICHKGHVPYEDIIFTSRFLEGAALTYMKRVGVVAPNRKKPIKLVVSRHHAKGEKILEMDNEISIDIPRKGRLKVFKSQSAVIEIDYVDVRDNYFILEKPLEEVIDRTMTIKLNLIGAYVKEPVLGRHEWIYDLDLQSLYPSIIMTLNISPETKIGKVLNWDAEEYIHKEQKDYIFYNNGKKKKMNRDELCSFLTNNKYSIAANGTVYRMDTRGFIPTILDLWFDERVEYKNKMKEFKKKGDNRWAKYYNLRQNAQKVLLNAFYGVLALQTFRFYDIDNAEAITSSGQSIIKFTRRINNHYYNTILGTNDVDYCIYIDTDSVFYSALPLVKHKYPTADLTDEIAMSKYILDIATDVQKYINNAYNIYAEKFHNVRNHRLFIKQEMIGKSGFWAAKKRYAIWVINKEGVSVDELEIKGLDVIRSDFPIAFQKFMSDVLWKILKFRPKEEVDTFILKFKENLDKQNIQDIMFSTSVSNIEKYNPPTRSKFEIIKGTPAHVKAALIYNDILDIKNYLSSERIKSGDKIKWTYLKNNSMQLECCALKFYKDPDFIVDFISNNIDYHKIFEAKLAKKLEDFYFALGWDKLPENTIVDNFFSF